jgi:uncharacterized membrane protein
MAADAVLQLSVKHSGGSKNMHGFATSAIVVVVVGALVVVTVVGALVVVVAVVVVVVGAKVVGALVVAVVAFPEQRHVRGHSLSNMGSSHTTPEQTGTSIGKLLQL